MKFFSPLSDQKLLKAKLNEIFSLLNMHTTLIGVFLCPRMTLKKTVAQRAKKGND